jgi:RNA polymerase sigma factor (sigma-70 family)
MDAEVAKLLPLARHIARDFSNIPGLDLPEIEIQAQEALAAAGRQFDPSTGDFTAYSAHAVRYALRSLYEKQVRHHHHHAYVLDQPAGMQSTQTDLVQNIPDTKQESVATKVNRAESIAALQRAMAHMPERFRGVLTAIGQGRSYSEICDRLGMTKQGVHKIATAAIQALRENLESQGYGCMTKKRVFMQRLPRSPRIGQRVGSSAKL